MRLKQLYPIAKEQTQKLTTFLKNHHLNRYKYSYSDQFNIQSLLIPSPLHCELNCIARTPLANRDCCHENKKAKTTHKKLTIPFFRNGCPNPQNCGRPRDLSLLASVSIRHERSRPNLSPKEQKRSLVCK
ncbi:hypothetical protein CEXT_562991 [Caerostris extrusa]|uniref:Uncharacterized protein n=1 Tax=Caerostris extrusa TaxID=172846 RepID=A0AAV4WN45_CAEEX|nr:hypothetical protein CEXT_562991 [Caerostris extrusa]